MINYIYSDITQFDKYIIFIYNELLYIVLVTKLVAKKIISYKQIYIFDSQINSEYR